MDGSSLFTSGPVVAAAPDCIRVTMVLLDIFGLASSQGTWLNLHTCTRIHTLTSTERDRDAAGTPALREDSFPARLEAESLEDLLLMSAYFLGLSLSFPWHFSLLFTLVISVS